MHFFRKFLTDNVKNRRKQNHRIDADRAAHRVCDRYVRAVSEHVEEGHGNNQCEHKVDEDPYVGRDQEAIGIAIATLLPVLK